MPAANNGLRSRAFLSWLVPDRVLGGAYRHARLDEDSTHREAGLEALSAAVKDAHADAQRRFEKLLGDALDPFDETDVPAAYPHGLHTLTLQGYLGEIFAAIVAENFAPHGVPWEVPAFLFRFHNAAFESLDRRLLLGDAASRIPGRTGDDCIAFFRNEDGEIEAWLNCEAKCTGTHSSSLITKGHAQLCRPLRRAASGLQLLEVLQDSDRADAAQWVAALRLYRARAGTPDEAVRADLFMYVCGQRPSMRSSWIVREAPHWSYVATHPLEAVEVHLDDVDRALLESYPGHVINRA